MTGKSIGHGTVLAGRFRLEDLVAETDGAKFWRATDRTLARSVAVNVVDSADSRASALLDAARTSATVTEGHFLRVLDAAEEDGFAYVVHEWGSGVSLDKMLAEGPLPPRRAAWVVKEVADAVATAHQAGIAHGRLVPENVMVTEAGAVKLIGFVVDAVLHGRQPFDHDDQTPLNDHESDVHCLGSLLYASLVARWPGMPGTKLPPAPRDHGRPLRPRQVRAGIPRSLDAICDAALAVDRRDRIPLESAHEISAALSDYIGETTGVSQVGYEATSVIEADDLAFLRDSDDPTTAGVHDGDTGELGQPVSTDTDGPWGVDPTLDPEATQAAPPPRRSAPPDPEATQAGAPLFHDDSGVGWLNPPASRGLRSDEGRKRPAPPPPPPFPEPEARPLFAPGPPRAATPTRSADPSGTGATAGAGATTGRHAHRSHHGTGSLPPVWGPDADDGPADDRPTDRRDSSRSWLRLAAVIAAVLVLVLAVVFAFNLGRGTGTDTATDQPSPTTAPRPPQPVQIASVSDLDPAGDPPEENPELAPLAADGDPGTAWQTMTYYGNPKLGLLKDGVGLVVDLGRPTDVAEVQVTLQGEPTALDVLAAAEGAGPPADVTGLKRIGSRDNAGTDVDLSLDRPVTTRYLVVWLTSLPPSADGYQGNVAEIVVKA